MCNTFQQSTNTRPTNKRSRYNFIFYHSTQTSNLTNKVCLQSTRPTETNNNENNGNYTNPMYTNNNTGKSMYLFTNMWFDRPIFKQPNKLSEHYPSTDRQTIPSASNERYITQLFTQQVTSKAITNDARHSLYTISNSLPYTYSQKKGKVDCLPYRLRYRDIRSSKDFSITRLLHHTCSSRLTLVTLASRGAISNRKRLSSDVAPTIPNVR